MANYLTYPFRTMRITQSYTGTTSHYPHMTGTPKDFPIDEGGKDSGRDPVYATYDFVVKRVYGVGNSGVNTVWIESTAPVTLANGKTDYVTIMLTHPNDSDVKRLKAGTTIKKGAYICYEGTDGATGNHIHLSVGAGKMVGNGWTRNSKGKYVLSTSGGTLRPEEAFFVDSVFTTIKDSKGLKFKMLPATPGIYMTTAKLNVRTGTTDDKIKPGAPVREVLPVGKRVEVTKVKTGADGNEWGRILSGWICLKYAKKVK